MKKLSPPFTPMNGLVRLAAASPLLLCLLSSLLAPAQQQKPKYPAPPPPMSAGISNDAQPVPSSATARRHIDLVKLQEEADELSQLAQTIPADMTSVRHNMLPKDMLEKLKRIEKLSKHVRSELTP